MMFESVEKLQLFFMDQVQSMDRPKGPEKVPLPFPLPTVPNTLDFLKLKRLLLPSTDHAAWCS